jgi:hypothetical protein
MGIEFINMPDRLKLIKKFPNMKIKYCISCKKQLSKMAYLIGTKHCKKCAKKGKLNNQYKGGKPRCKNCNKLLSSYNSKMCKSCYINRMKKEHHPNWKKGISFTRLKCTDCGKLLCKSAYYSKVKRCKPCDIKINKKYRKVKHHINLNRKNNTKNNILILTNSKHAKLHAWAYKYLVKTDKVNFYLKWFFNQRGIKC